MKERERARDDALKEQPSRPSLHARDELDRLLHFVPPLVGALEKRARFRPKNQDWDVREDALVEVYVLQDERKKGNRR